MCSGWDGIVCGAGAQVYAHRNSLYPARLLYSRRVNVTRDACVPKIIFVSHASVFLVGPVRNPPKILPLFALSHILFCCLCSEAVGVLCREGKGRDVATYVARSVTDILSAGTSTSSYVTIPLMAAAVLRQWINKDQKPSHVVVVVYVCSGFTQLTGSRNWIILYGSRSRRKAASIYSTGAYGTHAYAASGHKEMRNLVYCDGVSTAENVRKRAPHHIADTCEILRIESLKYN